MRKAAVVTACVGGWVLAWIGVAWVWVSLERRHRTAGVTGRAGNGSPNSA